MNCSVRPLRVQAKALKAQRRAGLSMSGFADDFADDVADLVEATGVRGARGAQWHGHAVLHTACPHGVHM